MATTNWDQLYANLPTRTAKALRNARVKPEKLPQMADGEILSIEGLGDAALTAIRTEYPTADIALQTLPKDKKSTKKTKKIAKEAKKKAKKEKEVIKLTPKTHSRRYQYLKKQTDPKKLYPLSEAIKLQLQLSQSRKLKTTELHINLTESGLRGEIKLPHSTGKTQSIEIFSEKTITKINANKLDFDVLLATPKDMPQLARFAKILGPKGLMPNPKNGNLIEDPKKRAEELSSGATLSYKSEPKTPLLHLNLGPITQDSDKLTQNIIAIIKRISLLKIKSAYITTTHTPSTKIDLGLIE